MSRLTIATSAMLMLASLACTSAWKQGRATFYGNEPWYWSIHHGSCMFGYQWPDQGLGWDVAALSDQHPEYRGSCGACYEVRCKSEGVNDGYGEYIDRRGACRDEGASVVVKITDTCPCVYPDNYFSNKRWCCGDMDHFDISVWAFQKLTDMKWGVIPIKYRKVDCGHQPEKKASLDYKDMFPGEFPPKQQAPERNGFDYSRYFPNGGYLNAQSGDGAYMVSADEFQRMVGRGGSSRSSTAAFGKKK